MKNCDNNTPTIIFGLILLLSLFYLFSGSPIHNEGSLVTKNKKVDEDNSSNDDNSSVSSDNMSSDLSDDSVSMTDANSDDVSDSSIEVIGERSVGLNGMSLRRKYGDKYVESSYSANGNRNNLKNVDTDFYKVADVAKNYTDRYQPVEETDANAAPIKLPNKKETERDKYNVNSFLPQEEEKDWFETIETVDVKSSNLINIYRPLGVNTIGSSQKNATYDLRGTDKAVCPKFVVSPWLQSSIEPDRSMKSLC